MQNEPTRPSGMDDVSLNELEEYLWNEAAQFGASAGRLGRKLGAAEGDERWAINTEAADLLVRSSEILDEAQGQHFSSILGMLAGIQRDLQKILRESSEHGKYRRGGSEWTGGKEYVA